MAMRQLARFVRVVVCDGSLSTAAIDFGPGLTSQGYSSTPNALSNYGGDGVSSAALSGSTVTFTFTSTPPAGAARLVWCDLLV